MGRSRTFDEHLWYTVRCVAYLLEKKYIPTAPFGVRTYRLCVTPMHANVLVVILDQIYLTEFKLQSFRKIPLVSSNANDVSSIIEYLQK